MASSPALSNMTRIPCTLPPCMSILKSIAACHAHEKTAHSYSKLSIWFCPDPPNGSSSQCKLGFSTEEAFIAHRQDRHSNPKNPDPYVDSDHYALGPQVGKKFWCGFCRQVLNVGRQEWSFSRCKHIAYHFTSTVVRDYAPDGTLVVSFNHNVPSATKRGDWTDIVMHKTLEELLEEVDLRKGVVGLGIGE